MSLSSEIETLVKSVANNNPAPMRCEIIKKYSDDNVDVKTSLGVLKYVDCIGANIKIGDNAVILFLDENYEDYVVIADTENEIIDAYTKEEIDEKLLQYIMKSEVNGLVRNDGSIDTNNYSTFGGSYNELTDKPNIPTKTSELINDGDGTDAFLTQHQSLADYVKTDDARLYDTGWQYVVYENSFTDYGVNDRVRYRRIGSIVHIEGIFTNSSALTPNTTSSKFATISDSTCRPANPQYSLQQGSEANKFLLDVRTDGSIGIARYGTGSTGSQISAGSWLHCFMTYFVD